MFASLRLRRIAASAVAAALLATATVQAPSATAAGLATNAQTLPVTNAAETAETTLKPDLIVLYQGSETQFYGTVMRYTVANGGSAPAQNVVVSKSVKVQQSSPNNLAAPVAEQLGTLNPGQWKEITVVCGVSLGPKCKGSSISAKTSNPELTTNNNSASVSF